jgi:hypothetical protein
LAWRLSHASSITTAVSPGDISLRQSAASAAVHTASADMNRLLPDRRPHRRLSRVGRFDRTVRPAHSRTSSCSVWLSGSPLMIFASTCQGVPTVAGIRRAQQPRVAQRPSERHLSERLLHAEASARYAASAVSASSSRLACNTAAICARAWRAWLANLT